jgi:hypothetical protein
MTEPRLDRPDKVHHDLFDENTNEIGALGDIVEKHAGDAIFLTPAERSVTGVDAGEGDFEAEMLPTDPLDDEDDGVPYLDEDSKNWGTDQTGTVTGIARGFGTHLPQDLGAGGFQIEAMPDKALQPRVPPTGELDDYDDPPNK